MIGSHQVSEAHRIDALSHNIRKVLQDGRQFQYGRRALGYHARRFLADRSKQAELQKMNFIPSCMMRGDREPETSPLPMLFGPVQGAPAAVRPLHPMLTPMNWV